MYSSTLYHCSKCDYPYHTEEEALLCEKYHADLVNLDWKVNDRTEIVPEKLCTKWKVGDEECTIIYKRYDNSEFDDSFLVFKETIKNLKGVEFCTLYSNQEVDKDASK